MALEYKLNLSCSRNGDLWKEREQTLRTCIVGIMTSLIIVSNIINMVVLPRITQLQTTSRIFFTNLTVADLLVGCLLGIPAFVTAICNNKWVFGEQFCVISAAAHSSSACVSMLTLSWISIARYIAVLHPFKYRFITRKFCAVVICAIWVYSVFICLLPLISNGGIFDCSKLYGYCVGIYLDKTLILGTILAIPAPALVVVIFTSVRVVIALRRHRTPGERRHRENKSVKLLIITSAFFYLAYVPFVIAWCLYTVSPELQVKIPLFISFIIVCIAGSNSFVNVIIYMAMYKEFRCILCRMLKNALCCGQGNRQDNESYTLSTMTSTSKRNAGKSVKY